MKLTIEDIKGLIQLEVGKITDLSALKVGATVNMILVNPITKEEETIVVDIIGPPEQNQKNPETTAPVERCTLKIIKFGDDEKKGPVLAKKVSKKIILVVNVEPMPDE